MNIPPIDSGVLAQVIEHARRRVQYSAMRGQTPYSTFHAIACLTAELDAAREDCRTMAKALDDARREATGEEIFAALDSASVAVQRWSL